MAAGDETGWSENGDAGRWEDRRAHRRISLDAEVWIGQDGLFSRSTERLANLSLGGAFIELTGRYQLGSVFDLRMALDESFINSTAMVRRVALNHGIGVQFLDLSAEARQRLARFLDERGA